MVGSNLKMRMETTSTYGSVTNILYRWLGSAEERVLHLRVGLTP
jgi:hypothetical protein